SLQLENSGSVARDHLANERTWLAYVRTSLAIAGTGVGESTSFYTCPYPYAFPALVQLFAIATSRSNSLNGLSLQRFARPLGATTVGLGFVVLCIGVYRYFLIQHAMTQGNFPAARSTIIMISSGLAALAAVIFGVLIA
ncbi:hypothetical protein M422DRAFT_84905, partial [Sphaerobolus stellatus SS14]